MANKIIIVGGVAGGASTAARLRRIDEDANIIMFEKGEYISFANCGLPYYIGDVITEKESLVVQTPEKMNERFNIDVRVNSEVLKVFPDTKEVEVKNLIDNKIYKESYDKLVLSPGAEPIRPNMPGIDGENIYTLRNIPDTYKIKDFVEEKKPKKAVIIGAGFIGLELAENLHEKGIEVKVVELSDHVIGPLDYDMASIVHEQLKAKDVGLYLKDGVKAFKNNDNGVEIELASGKVLDADMAILSIGVRPETKLAKEAGLKIGETGGIFVDEYMRTSDENIYALGDAIEVKDVVSENKALIPLAGPANRQGRIVANNITGKKEKYIGTLGTSIVKVFDLAVALTGNSERILQRNKVEYGKCITRTLSHAGYYPGAIPMTIKLLFKKDNGKILGAQIVGEDGADKRIDVIATAINAGMTVQDLYKLELSYAPPFSSAKDPANIAGYVASNILEGKTKPFYWDDVEKINTKENVLLDVRTVPENNIGTIDGSINIPVDELRARLDELPKDKPIYVFCQVGLRGYIAESILNQNNFENVKNLSGGYAFYRNLVKEQSNYLDDSEEKPMVSKNKKATEEKKKIIIDACGLQCPGPIMKVYEKINTMNEGESLSIKTTDPSFEKDIEAWCNRTNNTLVSMEKLDKIYTATIMKCCNTDIAKNNSKNTKNNKGKTLVVFSDDLDKAIAAFIIANGAAAMGREVTLFFTFWGLNILRQDNKVKTKKDIISKMFGFMMPKGTKKLSLSKMNMFGMGPKMIKFLMKKKNVDSLAVLMQKAIDNNVKLIACNMSMELMGIQHKELIEGVDLGGVAAFLGAAEESDMNMFI